MCTSAQHSYNIVYSRTNVCITQCLLQDETASTSRTFSKKATKTFDDTEIVPKSDKRKAKKKTESSPKFSHEGRARVDQFFSLNSGLVRDGPQGKHIMLGFEGGRLRIFHESELFVFTGL